MVLGASTHHEVGGRVYHSPYSPLPTVREKMSGLT